MVNLFFLNFVRLLLYASNAKCKLMPNLNPSEVFSSSSFSPNKNVLMLFPPCSSSVSMDLISEEICVFHTVRGLRSLYYDKLIPFFFVLSYCTYYAGVYFAHTVCRREKISVPNSVV